MSAYRVARRLSDRAEHYIATLEHLPAERDGARIRAALEQAGLPALEVWVDFQRRFGGLVQKVGKNRFEWGLLHHRPHPYSHFDVDAIAPIDDDGERFVACCNCHGSDMWMLDEDGSLYWCFAPAVATSFEKELERDAFFWELVARSGPLRGVTLQDDGPAAEVLLARLATHVVPEASDACASVHRHEGVIAVSRGGGLRVYALANQAASVLDGIPHVIR